MAEPKKPRAARRKLDTPATSMANFAASAEYKLLPPSVVSTVKNLILDTIGTILAATTLGDGCDHLVSYARRMNGSGTSSLIGIGDMTQPSIAALVNGGMAHALNYDAVGSTHYGLLVPAPIAAGEAEGGITGKELIVSIAVAAEISGRINQVAKSVQKDKPNPFLQGQLMTFFGSALGTGRVLRLDQEQMRSALGLSLMQASGTRQILLSGDPPAKAIYGAFPNQAGIISAYLAREGLGAQYDIFSGEAGLFQMFFGEAYDGPLLDSDIGQRFILLDARFKPWPTSDVPHPYINAAIELRKRHDLGVGDISQVRVTGNPHIRPWCEPYSERRKPQNAASAANSIPFATSYALAHGNVPLAAFTTSGLQDSETVEIASQFECSYTESTGSQGSLEVLTTGGTKLSIQLTPPLGSKDHPMSKNQLLTKFRDCARHSALTLNEDVIETVIDKVQNLENVPNIRELCSLVRGGKINTS
jgi:2-methylcitrate dehydratase PrpD